MLADTVCKEVVYFVTDKWIREIVGEVVAGLTGNLVANKILHCIRYTTLHMLSCIKSLFISKINRCKEFSEAWGVVVSDSLTLYFSRLSKHCEPKRKNICKRARRVVIYITTATLNSQTSPRRGKIIDRIHKWRLRNYSFVFVFIILTSQTHFKAKILLKFVRANEAS